MKIKTIQKPSAKLLDDFCFETGTAFARSYQMFVLLTCEFHFKNKYNPWTFSLSNFPFFFFWIRLHSSFGTSQMQTATERLRQFQMNGGPQHSFEETIHRVSSTVPVFLKKKTKKKKKKNHSRQHLTAAYVDPIEIHYLWLNIRALVFCDASQKFLSFDRKS